MRNFLGSLHVEHGKAIELLLELLLAASASVVIGEHAVGLLLSIRYLLLLRRAVLVSEELGVVAHNAVHHLVVTLVFVACLIVVIVILLDISIVGESKGCSFLRPHRVLEWLTRPRECVTRSRSAFSILRETLKLLFVMQVQALRVLRLIADNPRNDLHSLVLAELLGLCRSVAVERDERVGTLHGKLHRLRGQDRFF